MYIYTMISPGFHIKFTRIPNELHLKFRWSVSQVYIVFKK